jgi:hypothetical protein
MAEASLDKHDMIPPPGTSVMRSIVQFSCTIVALGINWLQIVTNVMGTPGGNTCSR